MGDLARWRAAVLDLDGVLTDTASVHERAWKEVFDPILRRHEADRFAPFTGLDYRQYVDGKPRYDGVRSFLASRGIELPEGNPSGGADDETVHGLGKRKNRRFNELLQRDGVRALAANVAEVRRWKQQGLRLAVVSSSRNCPAVLEAAGLTWLFDARVDGNTLDQRGLRGKPEADMFVEAARMLGVAPADCLAVEDAVAGVQAARAAGFGLVVGVAPPDREGALRRAGAHVVVPQLDRLPASKRGA